MFRVEVDQNICIGAAPCVAIASNTFDLNADGKVIIKQQNGDSDELILQAAESCPVQAIKVFDEKGVQVYPKL